MIILTSVGKILLQMLMSLAGEAFLREAVILGLQKLVDKTEADQEGVEHKLLAAAKQAWSDTPAAH